MCLGTPIRNTSAGIDTYFTPFIASTGLNHKEKNDVLPAHNEKVHVVPQILTNKAEDFLVIAGKMKDYGYESVNLNLGCPSGTVVSRHRGAGMLEDTEYLTQFLSEIFEKSPLPVSIKTRIGMRAVEEWEGLLNIFSRISHKGTDHSSQAAKRVLFGDSPPGVL